MVSRIFAFIFGGFGLLSWFCHETIKAWFFDKVIHMNDPDILFQYGIPLMFFGAALWLLHTGNTKGKGECITQPTVRLDDVLKRITGLSEFPKASEAGSDKFFYECEGLREKALLGTIDMFGGVGWRTTRPTDLDQMIRERIPTDYWKTHRIDAIGFLNGDPRGMTVTLTGQSNPEDYYGIWLDKTQIDVLWPAPPKTINWLYALRLCRRTFLPD